MLMRTVRIEHFNSEITGLEKAKRLPEIRKNPERN